MLWPLRPTKCHDKMKHDWHRYHKLIIPIKPLLPTSTASWYQTYTVQEEIKQAQRPAAAGRSRHKSHWIIQY